MQKYLGHHRLRELFFLDDPSIQTFQHKAEHGKKPWWIHAHTKATMNTFVLLCMYNVCKQAYIYALVMWLLMVSQNLVPFVTHPHNGQCNKYKRNENNLKDILPNF